MIPVIVILVYLVIIAFIGSAAFRKGKSNTEDFFLANRAVVFGHFEIFLLFSDDRLFFVREIQHIFEPYFHGFFGG